MDVDRGVDSALDLDEGLDFALALALALAFLVLERWLGGGIIMARSCKNGRFRKNLP